MNHQTLLFVVFISLFGFSAFPIIPVIMELTTRKFNKIPISFTNTILFVTSQLFTIVLQIVSGWAFDQFESAGVLVIVIMAYLYLFIFTFLGGIDEEVK